jgi:hypothetical protein
MKTKLIPLLLVAFVAAGLMLARPLATSTPPAPSPLSAADRETVAETLELYADIQRMYQVQFRESPLATQYFRGSADAYSQAAHLVRTYGTVPSAR